MPWKVEAMYSSISEATGYIVTIVKSEPTFGGNIFGFGASN
jgi:hypothetical protein